MGEEGAGQVADALRVEEIELHETFDRALPRPLGELHALRDLALDVDGTPRPFRSEEHTSELQSLMRISYAVFCLKNKTLHRHHQVLNLQPYYHHRQL